MKNKLKKYIKLISGSILVLFIIFVSYSFLIEPNILRVYEKDIYLPNYNVEHNGLRIAVISDFHIMKYGINENKIKKIAAKTNDKNPDIIFLLGDIDVNSIYKSKISINNLSDIFSTFKAKYGVWSVLGNHDYNKTRTIPQMLKNAGIKLLEDESDIISVNNKDLKIYGLKDFWHFGYNENLIDKTQTGNSVIVLSHNPDTFPLVPDNISLMLSGHTHGGQLCFPVIGGVFKASIYRQRYLKGHIAENNKHLFVTSGLGNWIPARFGNIPEIVILNLYSQDSFPDKKIINTPARKGINQINMIKIYYKYLTVFKKDSSVEQKLKEILKK